MPPDVATSPSSDELSSERTECKKNWQDNVLGNFTRNFTRSKGSQRSGQDECLQRQLSNQRRRECICGKNIVKNPRTGCTLSTVVLLCLRHRKEKASGKLKDTLEIQIANRIIRSTKEKKVYIRELGSCLHVTLVGNTHSVLSLGRFCDELGHSSSWQPREKPT